MLIAFSMAVFGALNGLLFWLLVCRDPLRLGRSWPVGALMGVWMSCLFWLLIWLPEFFRGISQEGLRPLFVGPVALNTWVRQLCVGALCGAFSMHIWQKCLVVNILSQDKENPPPSTSP